MADAEYYRDLKNNPPKVKKKPKHTGNWSLVLWIGGKVETILADKPYAMCVSRMQVLKNEPRCRTGTLQIVPSRNDKSPVKAHQR